MKVIFLQDVTNVAHEGDVKEVKRGFAVNYLFKNRLALEATEAHMKALEKKLDAIKEKEKVRISDAKALAEKIKTMKIAFDRKAGESGKLYGAVTGQEIADALKIAGLEIDKKIIDLKEPIKELGAHTIKLNLYKEIKGELSVTVNQDAN